MAVKPTDLSRLHVAGRPAIAPDGDILVAISTPDLDTDRYTGLIRRLGQAGPVDYTGGPRDSAPVLSPDGATLVFARAGESGPPQLFAMPRLGGEPRRLTDHKLGAGNPVFSPDGHRIAYLSAVPESGRYGTDEAVESDAEAPRRITRMSYRSDGKGFVIDRPEQIFVLDLDVDDPVSAGRQVTAEPLGAGRPAWADDGRVVYARSSGPDALTSELAVAATSAEKVVGDLLAVTAGDADLPIVAGGDVLYIGQEYTGADFAGRTAGLWSVPLAGGAPRRMTDEHTVQLDPHDPVVLGDSVLVLVQDHGAVRLVSVPLSADRVSLTDLTVVIGGDRAVKAFSVAGTTVAAVVADPTTVGEVITVDLAGDGSERTHTELGADLREAGVCRTVELTATSKDGHPVHGFLVLPDGDGPHPVVLDVHGGPHAQYTFALFDEAQVYAGAGYAVVLPNPRGSSGYGEAHGRAIVGAMGTVDVDDVLALLDAALERSDCDGDRVGVMGGSYGGFMTSWLVAHEGGRFAAGISERAVNAWDSFAGSSDIGYFFAEAYVGTDRDEQWRRSPLAYADQVSAPLLIIHSEHDWRCPIEQGQRLYVALKRRWAEVEMLLFPAEGHELSRSGRPKHRLQRFEAILEWWAKYLPVS